MDEHGRLTHLVDLGAVFGRALHALDEEVDKDRLPVGADELVAILSAGAYGSAMSSA